MSKPLKKEQVVKESANEPYEDSVKRALRAASKAKDAEAVVYYNDCLYNHSACASFEQFKGSAAYGSWVKKIDVAEKIEKVKAEYKRFAYMNETGKKNDTQQFDVESDAHWNDEKMIGLMKQKDVGQGHGTLRFKSNTGTTYTVELDRGKILSLKDHRGNEYELPQIQKYWEKGFPLIGAIAATIGDPDSSAPEDEKQSLYPPEELQETQSSEDGRFGIQINSVNPSLGNKRSTWYLKNKEGTVVRFNSKKEAEAVIEKLKKDTSIFDRTMKSYQIAHLKGESELQETEKEPVKEKLPRKRCERCGKPVNPGISSTKCPSCHESDLADAERYYGVQESMDVSSVIDPANVTSRKFIRGWENSKQTNWKLVKNGQSFIFNEQGVECKKVDDHSYTSGQMAVNRKITDPNLKVWVKDLKESATGADTREINPLELTDIQVDGINKNDWPDFVDSYVVAANWKGRPLTPQQIEWLNQNHPDTAQEEVRQQLGAVDFDEGVSDGGAHADRGDQISTTALSEKAPPGFPKSIYEKLVIKFKGNKKKINEVMWELHNKSKRTGGSLDEKTPPSFPKSLHDKLLLKYKAEPEKAYAIMWKLHNEHGDKLESVVSEATEKLSSEKKCKQCSHEAVFGDRKVRMAEPGSDFCKPCKSARLKAPRTLPKK